MTLLENEKRLRIVCDKAVADLAALDAAKALDTSDAARIAWEAAYDAWEAAYDALDAAEHGASL